MKYYNVLYAVLSTFGLFFYSLGMETSHTNDKKIISLIKKIKTQQKLLENIWEYILPKEQLCDPDYFRNAFEILAASEPKEAHSKAIERSLEERAISCINQIIYQNHYVKDCVPLIIECFHNSSLPFLRKTILHNEKILKRNQLFDYYQQIISKKPKPIQEQPIIPQTRSEQPKTHQTTPSKIYTEPEIKETKKNEIKFIESTYKGLMYHYQAYVYWTNQVNQHWRNIDFQWCNINDPFINVEITVFDKDGNIASHRTNFPLPLPILLNDDGTIKEEILLPLSEKPFIVNDRRISRFHKELPNMALQFYKNIEGKYNENDIDDLAKAHVIQKQDSTYIHGQNSCKPLLKKYFKLWGIPKNEYKPIQEPSVQPEEPEQPKEQPKIGWLATLQAGVTTITSNITNFFKNIYRYFFG